ncbi:hypothetical protein WA158_006206 [Blastocystis sp. Blastoise]
MSICYMTIYVCVLIVNALGHQLHVNENGHFKIEQFTDLHYGDGNYDDETTQVMRTVLKVERPDFIAFTGDMVAGYSYDHTPGWYKKYWKRFTSICTETQIYYGCSLGNHDSEADLSREEIMILDKTHYYSLSQLGPSEITGSSNYYIPIYAYNNTKEIVFIIWFFDSMSSTCQGFEGYGCVEHSTIEWYKKESKRIEEEQGHLIQGVAFFHIPTQEFMTAPQHWSTVGTQYERVSCSPLNNGLISTFLSRGDIKGVFVGHDHNNCYQINYNGILLAYGRKTGIGCYGPSLGQKNGGRTIDIIINDQHNSTNNRGYSIHIESWITNSDGEREHKSSFVNMIGYQDICNGAHVPYPHWIDIPVGNLLIIMTIFFYTLIIIIISSILYISKRHLCKKNKKASDLFIVTEHSE